MSVRDEETPEPDEGTDPEQAQTGAEPGDGASDQPAEALPDDQSEPEGEFEPESESEPEPEPESDGTEPDPEVEAAPEPELDPEGEPEGEGEPEPEFDSDIGSEPETDPASEPEPEPAPAPDSEPDPEPEPQPDRDADISADEPETIVLPAQPDPTPDETDVTPTKKKRRRGRRAVLIAAGALVLLGGGYVAGAWYLGDRVPGDTTVAGVNISGLPIDEAERVLTEGLAEETTAPVDVSFGQITAEVDPTSAGLALDTAATVDSVTGFTLDPRRVFGHLFGMGEQPPVLDVDDEALTGALRGLAENLDEPPVEGAIDFTDGEPVITEPVDGTGLDVDGAAEVLAEEWLTADGTVELPATVLTPTIDDAVIEDAMTTQVEPMLSGPVTVEVNGETTELSAAEVAAAAAMQADGSTLTLVLDGEPLANLITERVPSVGESPQDAQIVLEGGEPTIIPAVTGTGLDPAELADAVASAAVASDAEERTAAVELAQTEPEFSTEDAEALGVTEVIGTYRTPYPSDPVRTENLIAGTSHINGTLLKPDEQFSLLEALRPISTANGYTVSGVVVNGFHSDAIGGGLSQVSTTTFNAAYESGLTDITHQPHSRWFSRYPEGREATVFDPSIDMVFENNTGYGVLIQAYVTDSHVVVTMWGTDVFDVNIDVSGRYNFTQPQTLYNPDPQCHAEPGGQQGFSVTVSRTVTRDGEVVEDDSYSHTYSPWNRVICGEEPTEEPSEDSSED
ncbi:VanW family protein [Ruania alkalisoli]|uniref:VanW family protein n=1 Tax=Ruania alkalisoli TaxID=2779775 RepID=A0A7M1SS79_9MICO|nr:VanW family protein [Ruania alkalisoli]QOR69844.1 VanW family protein [Ruania alkalisoli]